MQKEWGLKPSKLSLIFLDADSIISFDYLNSIKKSKEDSKWQSSVIDFKHLQDEERTKKLIVE